MTDRASEKPIRSPIRRRVSSETRTGTPTALVSSSMRAATFTASPIAVYSRRRGGADVADHDRAGVDADPDAQRRLAAPRPVGVEAGERLLHRERAAHRALGVIGLRDRRAEVRHEAVAQVLVERAAVREEHLDHARVALVQQRHDLLAA